MWRCDSTIFFVSFLFTEGSISGYVGRTASVFLFFFFNTVREEFPGHSVRAGLSSRGNIHRNPPAFNSLTYLESTKKKEEEEEKINIDSGSYRAPSTKSVQHDLYNTKKKNKKTRGEYNRLI